MILDDIHQKIMHFLMISICNLCRFFEAHLHIALEPAKKRSDLFVEINGAHKKCPKLLILELKG